MTRVSPDAARRVIPLLVALGLLAAAFPSASLAQAETPAPVPVADAFEVNGQVADQDLVYGWQVGDTSGQWRIELEGPAGESMRLELSTSDGQRIDSTAGDGRATLNDLRLDAGTWLIKIPRQGDPVPFDLRALLEPEPYDPEPNDEVATAATIEDDEPTRGRLGRTDIDQDVYRLRVPPGQPQLRDISLTWSGERARTLCLQDDAGADRMCRSGEGSAALLDVLLEPGDHFLVVDGPEDATIPYELWVATAGPPAPDREAEPNDVPTTASPFDADLGVQGRSSREDPDFHRVDIGGEPQLWQVRASGADLDRLSWIRGGEEVLAATPAEDGVAQIDDLYLVPGRHVFRVRTLGSDYRLEMTPLGPPDPDAEREPNNEDVRAQSYGIGERRVGRLITAEDVDQFRFTLAAQEHLRVRLQQPDDGLIQMRLHDSDGEAFRTEASEPGDDIDLDLWLRPGDYRLSLRPITSSDGQYELSSERLDPFVLSADQEPNHQRAVARAAPRSLRWEGRADLASDVDATWLPPLEAAGPVAIRLEGEGARARLFAGEFDPERLTLEEQEDGSLVAAAAPVGVPLYLEVTAAGPYSVALAAPGWTAQEPPRAPAVELRIEMAVDTVAAYWPDAQRIGGTIMLVNSGAEDLSLKLEALTSHYAWEARPEATTLDLPAGTTQEVPLEVVVRPDAWARSPVQLSVAVRDAGGGQVSGTTTLAASTDAPPADPATGWDVPEALLGGLDVAALGIGAEPSGSVAADREPLLYDGVTPEGAGFGFSVSQYPVDLVVDLAGEEPMPIRGTIINPLARGFILRQVPAEFELLLSTDGSTWESVLKDELQPLPVDQAFVVDPPVPATHAMLRILADHSGTRRGGVVALGEWKVVAEPGVVPESMPANIADPVRGGHLVRVEPFANSLESWYGMLDDDLRRQDLRVERDESARDELFEVVLGFQDGRAAQITELRWQDPEDSNEEIRLPSVNVEVSLDGPLGPWQPLGDWDLDRASATGIAPLELDEPAWARYVRLSAPIHEEARSVEAPGRIEVLERATDSQYRSILAEWGSTSRQGPYEWSMADDQAPLETGPDAGDTRETATLLELDAPRTDRAEILEDVDWYRLEVPPDANSLTVDVSGVPLPDVRLTLVDAAGAEVPTRLTAVPGGTQRYEADVEPGGYDLLVEQVPFNVAFTFDTSGSMGPFLDFVLEGMRAFAADVQPGREVVTILPFGYGPLLDTWQDQPDALEDAINGWVPGSRDSSNAEESLLRSMEELASREGTRAILVVTDAETGSFGLTPQLWAAFGEVAPVVYSVHVGASNEPFQTRNLMRSWADTNAGHYAFPATHAEMERAFERMSTRLRRPALYTLTTTAELVDRTPGTLALVAPPGEAVGLAPDTAIGIVLDTSSSMRQKVDGRTRIAVAKTSLRELLGETIAEGTPVAIRTLGPGGKKWKCRSRLEVPLGPLDRQKALRWVKRVQVPKKAGTPLTDALLAVPDDLAGVGNRIVVVITDGNESCGGDPLEAVRQLERGGISAVLNIVGFALDDEALQAQMATWAEEAGGSYFDAAGADDLLEAIRSATGAPFEVLPAGGGDAVARGTVGGPPVEVAPGTYRIEVSAESLLELEDVIVGPGASVTLELPSTATP